MPKCLRQIKFAPSRASAGTEGE